MVKDTPTRATTGGESADEEAVVRLDHLDQQLAGSLVARARELRLPPSDTRGDTNQTDPTSAIA